MLINHLGLDKFCNTVFKMYYQPLHMISNSPIWLLIPMQRIELLFVDRNAMYLRVKMGTVGTLGLLIF